MSDTNKEIESRIEKIAADRSAISSHYDLPPEFFMNFLGPRMAYSCAYFTDESKDIVCAESDKLKLKARKLMLEDGDRILDLGCGWGSFLFYAAEKNDCEAIGITLSDEQAMFVNEKAKVLGIEDQVRADVAHVYSMEYESESFDKILTVGAIEHIEDLNLTFTNANRLLKKNGLFLVHGMTRPWSTRSRELDGIRTEVDDLVEMHFGVGHWKSLWEVIQALELSSFEVLDHENITHHYQLTVRRWLDNLQANEDVISDKIIPDEKYREFMAFMAAYVVSFEMSNTICNQVLCQKHEADTLRRQGPLTRERMIL